MNFYTNTQTSLFSRARLSAALFVFVIGAHGALAAVDLASDPSGASTVTQSTAQINEALSPTVNINLANAAELAEALNGIGLSRAQAIVRYREQFGPFESVDELSEVSGIGSATLEKNRRVIQIR